jgi:TonB family protein
VTGAIITFLIAIIAPAAQAVTTDAQEARSGLLRCIPIPKLLYYEMLPDDRESRFGHAGEVHLSFIIDRSGHVQDVRIEKSTDSWFNDISVQSVRLWGYTPPSRDCIATTVVRFKRKD